MVNRFVPNAVSYHGKGVIQEIPGIVRSKGFKKAFIATDPDLVKFGVTKKIPICSTRTAWTTQSISTSSPTRPSKMCSTTSKRIRNPVQTP